MSKLHEALAHLRPKDLANVPLDDLETFMKDIFAQAETIANSVPPAPGGNDTRIDKPTRSDINGARNASEITSSHARLADSHEFDDLRKAWGKPVNKPGKDNRLGISVYKMAANDRHGAWFARTSVHEGLGFTKWKRALQMEFAESLAVQGGPGAGSVRGIAADQRLESRTVEGLGKLEIYQLSMKFPAPTAPREFVSMVLTSDQALSKGPRHYIIVSIPVTHPETNARDGSVQASYESVELIREVPIQPSKAASTTYLPDTTKFPDGSRDRGSTISFAESRGADAKGEKRDIGELVHGESELHPVEWVMVTRSDPGGGIPRFMVERGTPGSIVADTSKFLDWACAKTDDQLRGENSDTGMAAETSQDNLDASKARKDTPTPDPSALPDVPERPQSAPAHPAQENHAGLMSTLASAIPQSIQNALPEALQPASANRSRNVSDATEGDITDESDTSDSDSFVSVEEFEIRPTRISREDSDEISLDSTASPMPDGGSRYTKELEKLRRRRSELEAKQAKNRERQEAATKEAAMKSEDALNKAQERQAREKKKQDEKYQKELQKLERRKEKEAKKHADRRKKEQDKDAVSKAHRERDEYKQRVEILEKENKLLMEQVRELQKESTALQARLGQTSDGSAALNSVKEEVEKGRLRASSATSVKSSKSGLSRQVNFED